MKHIKPILLTTALTLLSFSAVLYTSCGKSENNNPVVNTDPCKDVKCQNGGTCKDGKCACVFGYEGEKCEKLTRDKFIGSWEEYMTCFNHVIGKQTVKIEPDATAGDHAVIVNDARGKLITADSIDIPKQQFGSGLIDSVRGYVKYLANGKVLYYYEKTEHIKGINKCAGEMTKK